MPHSELTAASPLLRFRAALLRAPVVSCEPKRREQQKAHARADSPRIVRPRGAQEARVPIMARRDDGHGRRAGEERPAVALEVDDELEHAMPVGRAERDGVFSRYARDGGQRGADVRVKHGELELQVGEAGVGLPGGCLCVVLGHVGVVDLRR